MWYVSIRGPNNGYGQGETSGHTGSARLTDIHVDRDNDTILIDVIPNGPTCHTGSQSRLNTEVPFSVQTLAQTVQR
ncbi:phosphoribosyl-AMP cyclohydrolase [Staphylococcus aureus]